MPVKKKQTEDRSYRLLKYEPLTYTLKVGRNNKLLAFDPVKKEERAIKHCPNQKSVFIEDQTNAAVVEPITFIKGFLNVPKKKQITQHFLEIHPGLGSTFELIDGAKDAKELIDVEDLALDVKQAIRDKVKTSEGVEELRAIVSVLISDIAESSKMTADELRNAAYDAVDSNLNRFVNHEGDVTIFDDTDIKRKAIAQHAFNSGTIYVTSDSGKIKWTDNDALITLVPVGRDYLDFFSTFLKTEEGMQVAREISKRE
jgi:hypothetical protein